MRCKHEMPFGAECRDDGTVRFRLWAPKAESVSLHLAGSGERKAQGETPLEMPMSRDAAGWHELVTKEAAPGTQYQFFIHGKQAVPDPASRFQPAGVHGPSEVIDPHTYEWRDTNWRGRPWHEAVIYELHVGTFSPEGTYAGVEKKLDYLAEFGITALELMPISSFPGERNWGYDGVLPYAPTANYGRPADLKHLIDAAHARKLMVFLDVVYNHFGPEGNYLSLYSPQFFTDRHHTPWGQAINFDGRESRTVRDYFIHNALFWLEEYRFDGLRLDAVHAIQDDSRPDILTELAATVRQRIGAGRLVHLILENDNNAARYLRPECPQREGSSTKPVLYDGQWNDDIHHALHVLLTGEKDAYYSDYAHDPIETLGRCLAEGFSYQGQASVYRKGERRGEPSGDLPPTSFVSFLQNHDQVGNRAFGERIGQLAEPAAIRAAMAILLLAPAPPLLFMGEEFAASTPFLFFCDFGPDLAAKVREGRRAEFPHSMLTRAGESEVPDPGARETFLRSRLDWSSIDRMAAGERPHRDGLDFYRQVLTLRKNEIVPLIPAIATGQAQYKRLGGSALAVDWPLIRRGSSHLPSVNLRRLSLRANLGATQVDFEKPDGRVIYGSLSLTAHGGDTEISSGKLPAYCTIWFLK